MTDNYKCECCGRKVVDLTKHHLIPRTTHSNKKIKKMFSKEERNNQIKVCSLCHYAFHDFFTEKELATIYNTLEKLKKNILMYKHIEWARKHPEIVE